MLDDLHLFNTPHSRVSQQKAVNLSSQGENFSINSDFLPILEETCDDQNKGSTLESGATQRQLKHACIEPVAN